MESSKTTMLAMILVLVPCSQSRHTQDIIIPPTPSHLRTSVTPLAPEDGVNGLKDIEKNVNDLCDNLNKTKWMWQGPRWWLIVNVGGMWVPSENKAMFDKITKDLADKGLQYPLLDFLDKFNNNGTIQQTKRTGLALARNTSDPEAMRDETITLDRKALELLHDIMHRESRLLKFLVDFVKANSETKLDLSLEAELLKELEPIRYPYVSKVGDALSRSDLGDLVFTIRVAIDVSDELQKTPEETSLQTEEHYYVYRRESVAKRVVDTMLGPLSKNDRDRMANAIDHYYQTAPNVALWDEEAKQLCEELIERMRGHAGPK